MRPIALILALAFGTPLLGQFIRGDANDDGGPDIPDAIYTLSALFLPGSPGFVQPDAADVNDNGVVEIADCAYQLSYLFAGGPLPPAPFPTPGFDTTPPDFPAAPSGEVTFRLVGGGGCPGTDVLVGVEVSSTEPIDALSMRFTVPDELTYVTVDSTPLEEILGESPNFLHINEFPDSIVIGLLVKFVSDVDLPPGDDLRLLDLLFAIDVATPLGSEVTLHFEDDLSGDPQAYNLASLSGQAVLAETVDGVVTAECTPEAFLRGDTNEDGTVSVSDLVFLLNYLFLGGTEPGCLRTGDYNDSEAIEVSDVVYGFNALFLGSAAIPSPFPACGPIGAGFVSCDAYLGGCP